MNSNVSLLNLPFELQCFYSNECYICRRTNKIVLLKRCSRCHMISYCSSKHQKVHYKTHQDLCKVISVMMKENNWSNLFESLYNTEPETWYLQKEKLFLEAQSRMPRSLLPYEHQMFLFPRCCLICHENNQNLLIDCLECPAISFCEKHNKYLNHTISNDCYWLWHCQALDADLKGHTRFTFTNQIEKLISCVPMNEVSKTKKALNLPGSMEEFLNESMKSSGIPEIKKFHASEYFTNSLTVLNALQRLDHPNYQTQNQEKSELTIHVTGCDIEFDRPIFWEILLHLLPNLRTLKVVIADSDSMNIIEPKICKKCCSREKKLVVETLNISYDKYLDDKTSDYSKPDLVVFYEFKLPEKEDERWIKYVETWGQLECPLVITTHQALDMLKIWEKLKSAFETYVTIIDKNYNTFSSIRPRRDFEKFDTVYTKNRCWILCKILKKTIDRKTVEAKRTCKKCGKMSLILDNEMSCSDCTEDQTFLNRLMLIKLNENNIYYQNSCHVCRGRPENLLTCTRCGMISYCGEDHRKEHWLKHRDLCKVIVGFLKESGSSNLFEEHKSSDPETWLQMKVNLMKKVQTKLGRTLLGYEQEMFKFPRVCLVCHETDPSILEGCECEMSFCKLHKNCPQHKLKCEAIKHSYTYDLCLTTFRLAPSPREAAAPILQLSMNDMPIITINVKLPPSMKIFIHFFFKLSTEKEELLNQKQNKNIPGMRETMISEYFSRPLTYVYAMQKLKRYNDDNVFIHVIGSSIEEVDGAVFWELLLHWLPSWKIITVILISPELSRQAHFVHCCEKCNRLDLKYELKIYGLNYEDYLESEFYKKPDFIVGFNLNIHECELGFVECTWEKSILAVARQNVPFILTSGSEDRAQRDHKRLCKILGKEINYHCLEKNPFRSLRPYRDYESEDVQYPNQYLIIYTQFDSADKKEESVDTIPSLKKKKKKKKKSKKGKKL